MQPAKPTPEPTAPHHDHISWVRTRLVLDAELMSGIRNGFTLISAGFGSFAVLDGVLRGLGKGGGANATEPSRIFALAATLAGITFISLALRHNRRMVAFVDRDAFGDEAAPAMPDAARQEIVAYAAIAVGVISFVALLFLQ
ncbi:MAG: hypothetical protein QM692_20980 [Thermomicrobiales bacterium]